MVMQPDGAVSRCWSEGRSFLFYLQFWAEYEMNDTTIHLSPWFLGLLSLELF